ELKIDVKDIDPQCEINLQLEPIGAYAGSAALSGMLAIDLANGAGQAIPIVFRYTPSSACRPPSCSISHTASTNSALGDCASQWMAPVPVQSLLAAGSSDQGPTLRADKLEIFFARNDHIVTARRSSTSAAWGPATPVAALNDATTADGTPHLSPD